MLLTPSLALMINIMPSTCQPALKPRAVENWGLATYRETALLALANVSTQAELQRVSIVVAHELAHFWFGDLTTMVRAPCAVVGALLVRDPGHSGGHLMSRSVQSFGRPRLWHLAC